MNQLNLFPTEEKRAKIINPFSISHLQRERQKKFIQSPFEEKKIPPLPLLDESEKNPMTSIYNQLITGIRRYFEKSKLFRGVLGLSGGIDSTLTLRLAVDALGSENVTGLIMPELGLTKPINITHAKKLCEYFEIDYYYVPINPFLTDFNLLPWKPNIRAQMNTKARVRMCLLYNFSNTMNALVIGTGNKSELMAGYGTKYGDMACDLAPLADLLKTEIFELARYLELPDEIIEKVPSAELSHGQTDEGEMGFTYKELDNVIKWEKEGVEYAIEKGINPVLAHKIFHVFEVNEHKRRLPPIVKINSKFKIQNAK